MKKLLATLFWLIAAASGAWASPATDGASAWVMHSNNTAIALTLTTTSANDIILVGCLENAGAVSSISDTAGLTWALRKKTTNANPVEEWFAKSTGALTGDTITVNVTSPTTFVGCGAFGVSGATFATPIDPYTSGTFPFTYGTASATVTTYNANDLLLGFYRFNSTGQPTAGSGWTAAIAPPASSFMLMEYKSVTATQSGTTVAIGTGNNDTNGGLVDALTSDAAPNLIYSSKTNAYDILNVGSANALSASKTNSYDILNVGSANKLSASKMNAYFILQNPAAPKGFFHSFPP